MNDHSHENPLEGVEFTVGQDAVEEARRVERKAMRSPDSETPAESSDPNAPPVDVEDLPAWIREHKRPDVAFERAFLCMAVELSEQDAPAFERLRRDLKNAGVGITQWTKRVDEARKEIAEVAQREQRERALETRRKELEERKAQTEAEAETFAKAEAETIARFGNGDHVWTYEGNIGADAEGEPVSDLYRSRPGEMWAERARKKGTERFDVTTGCSAYIREELAIYRTPDAQPELELVLSVCPGATKPSYEKRVSPEDLARKFPSEYLGKIATLSPNPRALALWNFLVGRANEERPTVPVYAFTGRHTVNGREVYLSAGNAISEDGEAPDVRIELQEHPMRRFALPKPPTGEALHAAIRAGLGILDLKPARLWVPLVGTAFASALGHRRIVLFLHAEPLSGKSTSASIVQRFFGERTTRDEFGRKAPPVNLRRASEAALAPILSAIGDGVLLLDDYAFSGKKGELETTLDRVVRGVFEASGRLRSKRSGGGRDPMVPRCALMITGETLASNGASFISRCLTLEVPSRAECSDIGEDSGPEHAASSGELARCMAGFIAWSLGKPIPELVSRHSFPGAHDRGVEILQQIATGASAFLRFAMESGVLSEREAAERTAKVFDALRETVAPQREAEQLEDLGELCLDLLRSSLRSSRAYLTGKNGREPSGKQDMCGWAPDKRYVDGSPIDEWKTHTGQDRLGYIEGNEVFLHKGALMGVLKAIHRKERCSELAIQEPGRVAKLWHKAGYLAKTDLETKRNTYFVRTKGFDHLVLRADVLWPDEAGETAPKPLARRKLVGVPL